MAPRALTTTDLAVLALLRRHRRRATDHYDSHAYDTYVRLEHEAGRRAPSRAVFYRATARLASWSLLTVQRRNRRAGRLPNRYVFPVPCELGAGDQTSRGSNDLQGPRELGIKNKVQSTGTTLTGGTARQTPPASAQLSLLPPKPPKPRKPRTPSQNDRDLAQWREIYAEVRGEPLERLTDEAWREERGKLKWLRAQVPDEAERKTLLELYAQQRDPFLIRNRHLLRYLMTQGRFYDLLDIARRDLANREDLGL